MMAQPLMVPDVDVSFDDTEVSQAQQNWGKSSVAQQVHEALYDSHLRVLDGLGCQKLKI